MQLVRFRHKGLGQLQVDGNTRAVSPAMAEKLSKLLFTLEIAETIEQWQVPRLETAPSQERIQGILVSDCSRRLAIDFLLRPVPA